MFVPIQLEKEIGVLEFVVLDADVPPLIPVGFLEAGGAVIDLSTEKVIFQRLGEECDIERLRSGYRALRMCPRSACQFCTPESVR